MNYKDDKVKEDETNWWRDGKCVQNISWESWRKEQLETNINLIKRNFLRLGFIRRAYTPKHKFIFVDIPFSATRLCWLKLGISFINSFIYSHIHPSLHPSTSMIINVCCIKLLRILHRWPEFHEFRKIFSCALKTLANTFERASELNSTGGLYKDIYSFYNFGVIAFYHLVYKKYLWPAM
jgi:hypothetical protein